MSKCIDFEFSKLYKPESDTLELVIRKIIRECSGYMNTVLESEKKDGRIVIQSHRFIPYYFINDTKYNFDTKTNVIYGGEMKDGSHVTINAFYCGKDGITFYHDVKGDFGPMKEFFMKEEMLGSFFTFIFNLNSISVKCERSLCYPNMPKEEILEIIKKLEKFWALDYLANTLKSFIS